MLSSLNGGQRTIIVFARKGAALTKITTNGRTMKGDRFVSTKYMTDKMYEIMDLVLYFVLALVLDIEYISC